MRVFRRRGGYYSHRAAGEGSERRPSVCRLVGFEKLIENALNQPSSTVTVKVQPKHPVLLASSGKEALEEVQI